jgi:hypothetical protein
MKNVLIITIFFSIFSEQSFASPSIALAVNTARVCSTTYTSRLSIRGHNRVIGMAPLSCDDGFRPSRVVTRGSIVNAPLWMDTGVRGHSDPSINGFVTLYIRLDSDRELTSAEIGRITEFLQYDWDRCPRSEPEFSEQQFFQLSESASFNCWIGEYQQY